ncbi:hypothetical protein NQ314_016158, partial [Rhamnusium bicolor]
MTVQPPVCRPWEVISTDLMGPFPRSTRGNQYILVVMDNFSKFSLVFPLRSATADVVSRKIEEDVFLVYDLEDIQDYSQEGKIKQEGFKKLFADVRQRLDKAAKKNERTYNLRRRCEEFLPNQLVWKKNFTLSDASKFYT